MDISQMLVEIIKELDKRGLVKLDTIIHELRFEVTWKLTQQKMAMNKVGQNDILTKELPKLDTKPTVESNTVIGEMIQEVLDQDTTPTREKTPIIHEVTSIVALSRDSRFEVNLQDKSSNQLTTKEFISLIKRNRF